MIMEPPKPRARQRPLCGQADAERQAGQRLAGPAHPGRRGLRVVAELLRHPSRAPAPAERLGRLLDGLPESGRRSNGAILRFGAGGYPPRVRDRWSTPSSP